MRSNQPQTSDGAAIAAPNQLAPHFELGRLGETLAIEYLERAGYRIVAGNFRLPIGRNTRDVMVSAEIDVVAYDGPTLCFVEVRRAVRLTSRRRRPMLICASDARLRARPAAIAACSV